MRNILPSLRNWVASLMRHQITIFFISGCAPLCQLRILQRWMFRNRKAVSACSRIEERVSEFVTGVRGVVNV
jgi:hypothetical protein